MTTMMMRRLRIWLPTAMLLLLLLVADGVDAHFVITYPQSRPYFYDTQFQFPCGGIPPTKNRTAWPTTGGALAFIPIHPFGLTSVNIAIGNDIDEHILLNPYNVPMVPLFNQTGANSTFCIPKIKIPKKIKDSVKDGVNATIQVIQLTATNAALYGCIDLTFSDKEADRFGDPEVWDKYCFNGTGMGGYRLGEPDPRLNTTNLTVQSPAARVATTPAMLSLVFAVALAVAVGLST